MELIRGLHNIRAHHRGCVASIGNFDGIHLGHQQILKRLKCLSDDYGLPATIVTFEPHPYNYFHAEQAIPRITTLRDKIKLLQRFKIDNFLVIRFDARLAMMSATDFVSEILNSALGVKHLVIGDDFRFGYQRQGDFKLLDELSTCYDYRLEFISPCTYGGLRVSSSRIRQLLHQGQCGDAQTLLGRPYQIRGRVQAGLQQGVKLGFRTANLALPLPCPLAFGVYAVMVDLPKYGKFKGAANIGVRPAISSVTKPLLEVHILDFNDDIYGDCLNVSFLLRLRDESGFPSLTALSQQIGQDVVQVRDYFANRV